MRQSELEAEEISAALSIGVDPFSYRGGLLPKAGGFAATATWTLNNFEIIQREAHARNLSTTQWARQRRNKLLELLGPQWDASAIAQAFLAAEAQVERQEDQSYDFYKTLKSEINQRQIDFVEAVGMAEASLKRLVATVENGTTAEEIANAEVCLDLLLRARHHLRDLKVSTISSHEQQFLGAARDMGQ